MTLETRTSRLPHVAPAAPWRNPSQLERPCFLLCFPFCYSTQIPNNLWMEDLPGATGSAVQDHLRPGGRT